MMKKLFFLSLSCCLLLQFHEVVAQSKKEKKEIIIKGNDKGEKMVIVVDGDKVTLNGHEITGDEDKQVMIMKEPIVGGKWRTFMDSVLVMNTAPVAQLGVLTTLNEKGIMGAEVKEVVQESAAANAGIIANDIIQQVDGQSVQTPEDLVKQIRAKKPGDEIEIHLLREGKKQQLKVKLGAAPRNPEIKSFNMEDFPGLDGMMDGMMNGRRGQPLLREGIREMKPRMGVQLEETESGKGLKVLEIAPDSPAEKAGLRKNDLIRHIGEQEVNSVDEMRKVLNANEGNLRLDVLRDGKKIELVVNIPRPLKRGSF